MTRFLRSTRPRLAVLAVAVAGAALLLDGTAFAGVQMPISLSAVDPDCVSGPTGTGVHQVQWWLHNQTSAEVSITSAELSGVATGSVTFSPNPVPGSSSSTWLGDVPRETDGTVVLTVALSWFDGELTRSDVLTSAVDLSPCIFGCEDVVLTANCIGPPPSTDPSTTTTTAEPPPLVDPAIVDPAAVDPVVVTPRFTG